MPSAATLNFEALLRPFEAPTASGKDLRTDSSPSSLYQLLKEDRKTARQLETRIIKGDTEVPTPEWRPVAEKATKILGDQSKDLEVCAYLIEALVRMHGLAGMRDGYRLARELVERFWDDGLYPSPGEADVERRCAHMLQLNGIDSTGALIPPIARLPFTEVTSLGQFSRIQMQEVQALAKVADPKARQAKIDNGAITAETIGRAVAETRPEFYQTLFEDAALAQEEFERFNEAVKRKSGRDEATDAYNYDPPSGNLQQAVQEYLDMVKELTKSKPKSKANETKSAPQPNGAQVNPAVPPPQGQANGAIGSREDALGRILDVAEYFRRTEPQSIVPYALEQVVHWGKLSLPDLLSELIADEAPRKNVFKQVGIKPPEPQKK
jgi:type VI secretion system protein ImpA